MAANGETEGAEWREKWLRDDWTRLERLKTGSWVCWHRCLGTISGEESTLLGHGMRVTKLGAMLLIAAGPFFIQMAQGRPAGNMGGWLLVFLWGPAIAAGYIGIYEKVLKPKVGSRRRKQEQESLMYDLAECVKQFGPMVQLSQTPQDRERMRAVLRDAIYCVGRAAQLHMQAIHEQFQVTVFGFADPAGQTMEVLERANARFGGKTGWFKAHDTLPFYVAKGGKMRRFPDRRGRHHFTILGDERLRSKYLMPLLTHEPLENKMYCFGVLSIESTRPYHFWIRRAATLDAVLQPYVCFLKVILGTPEYRIEVQDYAVGDTTAPSRHRIDERGEQPAPNAPEGKGVIAPGAPSQQ